MRAVASPGRAVEALLDRLVLVQDAEGYRRLMQALADPPGPRVLSFLNQHAMNLAWEDGSFREALADSHWLLRDGAGVAVLLKWLGREPGINLNGTDLIPQIVQAYKGRRVAVVGTAQPYLQQAVTQLEALGARIVFTQDGFTDERRWLRRLADARPELVLLGMGMPRQEMLAGRLASALSSPALIVNGGAVLDFLAGKFPRAPRWLRRLGLEWLYRLLREPRRLWSRYVTGGVRFVARAARLAWAGEAPGGVPLSAADLAAAGPHTASNEVLDVELPALAQLLRRVDGQLGAEGSRVIQFFAARPGDGATTAARGYARISARLRGRRVLLVSEAADEAAACLEDPQDHWGLDQDQKDPAARAGVTELRPFHGDSARAGAVMANPATWTALSSAFDDVVVDVGGTLGLLAAPHVTGAVVVVRAEATPAAAVRSLLDELSSAGARVLGAVLNGQRSHLPRSLRDRL